MDNITNLPSCKECNRILKNKDVNEYGLCPKCLAKIINTEVVEVQFDKNDTEEHEMNINISESLSESQSLPELVKAEIPTLKPGQAIRNKFIQLVNEGKIDNNVISILANKEGTAKAFGARYPFLKEFNPFIPIKEHTHINGHARYSSKIYSINGKSYLITNDLYNKTLPKFLEWADKGVSE